MRKYYLVLLSLLLAPFSAFAVSTQPLKMVGGGSTPELVNLVAKIGGYLLYVAGALAFIVLIIGGIRYIVSIGDATQTEAAKKTIIYAIVGVVICALALLTVRVVTDVLSPNPSSKVPEKKSSLGYPLVQWQENG